MKRLVLTSVLLLLWMQNSLLAQDRSQPAMRLAGQPSQLDLLNLADPLASNHPDTLRILAIRVEFVADTVQETNGTGKFDLSTPDGPTVDPPPHHRSYFNAQLQALANYYKTVSQGKLALVWEVWPQEENAAYQLGQNMSYYAPGIGAEDSDTRLAELLRDAFTSADAADAIDFGSFDSYIMFHAGVGSDVSFDFDPTPNDVPSAFLRLSDLQSAFGESYAGIPVQNGGTLIQEGIILPETQSQEGFEIGLLGTSAIMMGFQLGLPSLFDIDNGASGIGRWGLMDQGSGNFQGLLPAEPSAWEKIFLGWEKPIIIQSGSDLQVAAPRNALSPNKIYKIPISADEYFLIENRQRDINDDSKAIGIDVNGNTVEFLQDGTVVSEQIIGVIVSVDEYDFGLPGLGLLPDGGALPGSGILIWHIDESIVRENLPMNRVNSDRTRRGVDLEEADGAQDIGQFYGFLSPGAGAENGVPEDAWHRDNPINTLVNDRESVLFGPDSKPSSRSNRGFNSNVVIDAFSANAPLMSFSVTNNAALPGFPQFAGTGMWPPVIADFDPDIDGLEVMAATRDGAIILLHGDGSGVLPARQNVQLPAPGDELRQLGRALALQLESKITAPVVAADLNADGAADLVVRSEAGFVQAFSGRDADNDGSLDLLWQTSGTSGDVASPLSVFNRTIFTGNPGGNVLVVDNLGNLTEALALSSASPVQALAMHGELRAAAAGNQVYLSIGSDVTTAFSALPVQAEWQSVAIGTFEQTSGPQVVAIAFDGSVAIMGSGSEEPVVFARLPADEDHQISLGDVDGDGRQDIVITSASQVYAFSARGSALKNFPYRMAIANDSLSLAAAHPLLLDLDGDRRQEVLVTDASGALHAINAEGTALPGYPQAISIGAGQHLAAGDINADGVLELVWAASDGFLNARRLEDTLAESQHAWTAYGANAGHTFSNDVVLQPIQEQGDLLPQSQAFNYPNPTENNRTFIRYRLNGRSAVNIRIFDLAGELVTEFTGPSVPFADNEVEWRVDDVETGVYLARIEARGESEQGLAIFKIAVVK